MQPNPPSRAVPRGARRLALVAGAVAGLPLLVTNPLGAPLHAQEPASNAAAARQTGRLAGVVTDANQQPLSGAQVSLVGTRFGVITGVDGRYRLSGVPAGTYDVRVQRIGQRTQTLPGIAVRASEEATLDVRLEAAPASLGGVVVSASRRVEKITDAPATVTSITTDVIDNAVGNTFVAALKEAKGLDFIQVGMTSVAINARGFNSSFNNRFLMVEDGRISVLPENGLPVGQFTPTPKVDLEGMEVLVGPGSALYGPDASNGVLALRTKDPRQFPGATLEVTGGNRGYMDVQGRYAGVTGNLGYKISGEFQQANDWDNDLTYGAGGALVAPGAAGSVRESQLRDPINWDARVLRGTGALTYYMGANRLEVNGGWSRTDGVGQTNVGRNQLRDWDYNVAQVRYTTPHWYVNAYRAQSQSGTSFALNRFAGAQLVATNAALSADSLRKLSDWPSDGRMYAAEVQGNYVIPALRNTAVVFGTQYRNDIVSSDRQWLTDRITGEDVANAQAGVYAQTTTPVMPWLDVVLAGRLDDPENYARQWSPKAGVVVKPWTDQAFRVTFNRAYKSPTILQTNFFIPDWTSVISIYGNTTGFTMQNAAGQVQRTFKPLVPETNRTWEAGYKGILGERLYVDASYFLSKYENFMSPLTIVGNPFATAAAGGPTFAVPSANPGGEIPVNAQGRIVNQATPAITPIVLTYYNLGRATLSGVDLGINYYLTRRIELRATTSTAKLTGLSLEGVLPGVTTTEANELNAPNTKWTIGATAKDLGPVTVGATFRNVNAYYFRSGINTGVIPTFGTLDANVLVKLPALQGAMLNLGVSNLFTCSARDLRYRAGTPKANSVIESEDRACGFGRKHAEMVNMPEIGGMAFLGVRFQR
jgi:iron complex outermembrane receptor protein